MVQAMDEEENKMGLKRKSKHVVASVDSGDDEPIGTLLKLKGKRNSKRSKVAADGGGKKVKGVEKMAAVDDELGGMNDTLAIFRKKLRGPKKDGGSAIVVVKGLSSNLSEPICQSLDESLNLTSEVKRRCPGSNEGESSGSETIMKSAKVKAKTKNKRSRMNLDEIIIENPESNDVCDDMSGNDALRHAKEVATEGEALEDSLSAFFQNVQSGITAKSRNPSRLKLVKVSDDAGSEAAADKSLSTSIIHDNSYCAAVVQESIHHLADSNQGLSCNDENSGLLSSVKISPSSLRSELGDAKTKCEPPVLGNAPPDSDNFPNIKNDAVCCVEADDLGISTSLCEGETKANGDVRIDRVPGDDCLPSYSGQTHLHPSPFTFDRPQKDHDTEDLDGPVTVLGTHFEEVDLQQFSSPESDSANHKFEVVFRKRNDESGEIGVESEHTLEPSHAVLEGECRPRPNFVDPSVGEDINGNFAKDGGCLAEPETKDSTFSVSQRAARNAKKQRHGDMAYEGDVDWDVLIQSQELFGIHREDKTREKLNPIFMDDESGKAAAVAAGLKACAVSPLEKIKFKEVLKRKGGLQEYLACRSVYPVTNRLPSFPEC